MNSEVDSGKYKDNQRNSYKIILSSLENYDVVEIKHKIFHKNSW